MKNFGIVTNRTKDPEDRITKRICAYLEGKGAFCSVAEGAGEIPENCDCILVLGGDGTMLRAARETAHRKIPLLGVNLGTLGYLAEVEMVALEEALDKLLEDQYETEERMMLQGRIRTAEGERDIPAALNDISITRCGTLQIIKLKIYVNGLFLCEWKADGIVISTPTGSTGYNMSAGGPLVEPGAALILLTPVCAHTLNARSIVLRAEDEVEIEVASGRGGSRLRVEANSDGSDTVQMETGDRIRICKSKNTTAIAKLSRVSFLETLHAKMSDGK